MEIFTDSLHRIAYATDASAYREMPLGVAYPRTEEDVRWLMAEARRRRTCLIPRAGGTSIAGQVVGNGIVVDVSRYMNRILEINAEERWVRVQPGVVRDELNKALLPYGLFFSPETSTSNRCCIGGMVGNNSCGTHSLVYGSTRHHVLSVRALLSDGTVMGEGSPLDRTVHEQLEHWRNDSGLRRLLAEHFPDKALKRRSCGYALDECLEALDGDSDSARHLADSLLLTGSEGTLAFVTEITLSLDSLPPKEMMVVCLHLNDLNEAWHANLVALRCHPTAIELMDGKILELCKGNIEAQKNRFFVQGDPAALLIVEFRADTRAELDAQAQHFVQEYAGSVSGDYRVINGRLTVDSYDVQPLCSYVYGNDVQRVWALRKAGLGVLTSGDRDAKPVGVIEDTAVAPERMEVYMADFQAMMKRLDLDCVYYGHISTGELHLRPVLNLKDAKDLRKFREVATETARLVKKHKGSLSGEHGDGRLRGEFIPLMYGEEVYDLFCRLKRLWDPDGILNVGKIVNTPPMDAFMRYGVGQSYAVAADSKVMPDVCGLMRRIERCNGAGDCRKSTLMGGTMCPAFKASGDELKTTRARANVLREKLTRDPKGLLSPEVAEVLDSCLACKGCRRECPSDVDMTSIRSEVLQAKFDLTHTPLRTWMVARMARVERFGSLVPTVYNWFAANRWTAGLIKKTVRFSVRRNIPALSRHTMRWCIRHDAVCRSEGTTKGKVYLFADEFTDYQEAELGLTFARLVRRLGYEVVVPKHVESGRAAISKGCLHLAAKYAAKNVSLLGGLVSDDTPLIGIEPSCILSFRDEYPRLVPLGQRETAIALAKNCLLYDEWLMREVAKGNITSDLFRELSADIWLHGHCHQKALVGVEKTAEALRLIPGVTVHVIPSGCCGMAGSFGYEEEHYETSMAIGETVLFPAIRQAVASSTSSAGLKADKSALSTIICAPGTSCRQQIMDGTGITARHPLEILYAALK